MSALRVSRCSLCLPLQESCACTWAPGVPGAVLFLLLPWSSAPSNDGATPGNGTAKRSDCAYTSGCISPSPSQSRVTAIITKYHPFGRCAFAQRRCSYPHCRWHLSPCWVRSGPLRVPTSTWNAIFLQSTYASTCLRVNKCFTTTATFATTDVYVLFGIAACPRTPFVR